MTYTQIYNKIYSTIKNDSVPHHFAHSISIRITEAISDYRMSYPIANDQVSSIINQLLDYMEW